MYLKSLCEQYFRKKQSSCDSQRKLAGRSKMKSTDFFLKKPNLTIKLLLCGMCLHYAAQCLCIFVDARLCVFSSSVVVRAHFLALRKQQSVPLACSSIFLDFCFFEKTLVFRSTPLLWNNLLCITFVVIVIKTAIVQNERICT